MLKKRQELCTMNNLFLYKNSHLSDPRGPLVHLHAEGRGVGEVEPHPDHPHGRARHESPEGAPLVHPPPADGQAEGHGDGRGEVRGEGLWGEKEGNFFFL